MRSRSKLLIIGVFIGIGYIAFNLLDRQPPLTRINISANNLEPVRKFSTAEILEHQITQDLQLADGDFSIIIQDLSKQNGEEVIINPDQAMPAASLYKLYLMASVLKAEEESVLAGDQELSATIAHLDAVLGSREFGYDQYSESDTIRYTVDQALMRIASLSDNYAAVLLAEKIGWDKVQDQANQLGASSTVIKDPIRTSARDMALFLTQLYHGRVVSTSVSNKIIELLSHSQLNDRIPDKLPEGLKIAHKTGELDSTRHDVGIIFLAGRPYLIVLMSTNLRFEDNGVATLSQISQNTYDYFRE